MTDEQRPEIPSPNNSARLRTVSADMRWIKRLGMIGALLVAIIIALTLFAPSALWFLFYPLLIMGALGALALASVLLLRFL
jgi:archaellum biogenesis protein FlaJ (TadC family)